MSTAKPPTPAPTDNGRPAKPAAAAVIRRMDGAEETAQERLIRKHVPAWVVSGAIHLTVIALAALLFGGPAPEGKTTEKIVATTVEKEPEESEKDLTNEDPGLESNLAAAIPELDRIDKTVDAIVTDDPVGVPDAKMEDPVALKDPGIPSVDAATPGATGETGLAMAGGNGAMGNVSASMSGRSGATKSKLIREGGGNEESERAVARGLAWLARQQKQNGSWVYDGDHGDDMIAATGMALLPFLAAGETHKKGGKYAQTVDRGLKYLVANLTSAGKFNGKKVTMYSQGIGTIALCEAYGMTRDKGFLLRPAQAAVNFVVTHQAGDGSWGYAPGTAGDTSIVGWQVQALKAAQLTKDLVVPDAAINKAIGFLDKVSSGSRKAVYGYNTAAGAPGTALTAVGLLCRYYISKWGPGNAGLAEGVDGLMKKGPQAAPAKPDMYYFYYATQVVHFNDGPEWKDWNEGRMKDGKRQGGMRDWLINLQNKKEGAANAGSWDPDAGSIGRSCGRVGTTAMSLLTLEVYYRHLPLYKRDGGGKILDAAR